MVWSDTPFAPGLKKFVAYIYINGNFERRSESKSSNFDKKNVIDNIFYFYFHFHSFYLSGENVQLVVT